MSKNAFPARLKLVDNRPDSTGSVVGWVTAVSDHGEVRVDFDGNVAGPLVALTTVRLDRQQWQSMLEPVPVLLMFNRGDLTQPIVVGLISQTLFAPADPLQPSNTPPQVTADGERLTFEASREIVLRCGEGCITLTADGRIVIKGTQLVSRASETNKIRGATVQIN